MMKMLLLVLAALLFAGCASSQQSASLTAEQTKIIAIKLANDKA